MARRYGFGGIPETKLAVDDRNVRLATGKEGMSRENFRFCCGKTPTYFALHIYQKLRSTLDGLS